jgi:hypothetical protein
MTTHDPTSSEPERASLRWFQNLFIGCVLALQIGVPLSYYLSARAYDERFSWRMFSTLRLRDCQVQVLETVAGARREVAVQRDVQLAWLRLLERMRSSVIDKYLARRCEQPQVEEVEFIGLCQNTDGQTLPTSRRTLRCPHEAAR